LTWTAFVAAMWIVAVAVVGHRLNVGVLLAGIVFVGGWYVGQRHVRGGKRNDSS
jgi:hypothetical protein